MSRTPLRTAVAAARSAELAQALPAIIAAAKTGRRRETGEITVDSDAVREAACKIGYVQHFTHRALAAAMRTIGARRAPNSHTGAKYVFPSALCLAEAVKIAADNADQVKQAGNE
ncbi:hypothetical protein B0G80_0246 [Paraburkholderia sp. BL6669N2]|nr:hypothetical protein B0G80_0246 [Paraburkholderia sp. BL6669N2]